jgi:hypothetical protein
MTTILLIVKPANDPAFKRRGDYELVEVAKLIPCNQVPSHPVRVRFKTPCYLLITSKGHVSTTVNFSNVFPNEF